MKHLFTIGILVLAGQLGFAGAYFLKLFLGKQPTLRVTLSLVAVVLVKMMGIRDRLF